MGKLKLLTKLAGLLLLCVAAFILNDMDRLAEQQLLWGYRPLWLYLTAYAGLIGLFYGFEYRAPVPQQDKSRLPAAATSVNHSRAILWSTASGLLLGFGFPGYIPFPFLLLFAFVPLLLLQREQRLSGAGSRQVFFHGLHAFLLYNILATYWVTNTAFGPGLFAVVANSLLMCIPWMLFHWTSKHFSRLAYLAFIVYWLGFEWGHYNWDLNWPWLGLGNGLAEYPSLIQWYAYTGALGGGVWILAVNVLILLRAPARWIDGLWDAIAGSPFWATEHRGERWKWWAYVILFLPPIWSLYTYYTYQPPANERITVTTIQPNFEPHYEKFTATAFGRMDTFTQLSLTALQAHPNTDYLVYPETSFDRIDEDEVLANPDIRELLDRLQGHGLNYLVTGYDGYHIFAPGEARSTAVRQIRGRDGSTIELEALNAALQLDLTTQDVQTYRKGVFVPGAESFPFRNVLGFALPLVEAAGGSTAGRGTQERRTPFSSPLAKIAPVICYESVFGNFFRGYIHEGAQAVFVMTNDGWWDHTAGHLQHLWFSSLRAIETRRDVVRSANMGACAFIDQRGKILSRTEYGRPGYLHGSMQLNDQRTFYVRYGDIIPLIALAGSICFLFSTLWLSIRRRWPKD